MIIALIRIWGFTMDTHCLNDRLGTARNHPVLYISIFMEITQNLVKNTRFHQKTTNKIFSKIFSFFELIIRHDFF